MLRLKAPSFPKSHNWLQSLRGLPVIVKIIFYCYHFFLTVNWEIKMVPKVKQVIKKTNPSALQPVQKHTAASTTIETGNPEPIYKVCGTHNMKCNVKSAWTKERIHIFRAVLAKSQAANGVKAVVTATETSYEGVGTFLFGRKWEK